MIPADYYRYRIQKALVFIENHLSERISAADIARAAHFSAYHFHRLFSAYMGEPVHKYVLSRRLERGAQLLREQPSLGLAEVALSVGFETHSAFSRAFRRHFGETPSAFRSHNQTPGLDRTRPFLVTMPVSAVELKADIQTRDTWVAHCRRTQSTVDGCFFARKEPIDALQRLWDLHGPDLQGLVSCYPASPKTLNDEAAEVWYGGLTRPGRAIGWSEFELELEGGNWAVFEHRGDYRYLHQTWCQIYRAWLPRSGWQLRDVLPFEKYLSDPRQSVTAELLTEIWIPVDIAQDRNSRENPPKVE